MGLALLWLFLCDLKLLYLNRYGRSSWLQLQCGGGDFGTVPQSPKSLSRDLCVTGGCRAAWWPWARRGHFWPLLCPPCALHCAGEVMPHWGCPRWGLSQACGCLGGFGDGPGSDSLVWMWGRGGPAQLAASNLLWDVSCFVHLRVWDGE